MKHLIKVEQRHIDHGSPQSCSNCPIALSIMETTKEEYIAVSPGMVKARTASKDLKWYASLPFEAILFILNFDSFSPVTPFEFELETHEK